MIGSKKVAPGNDESGANDGQDSSSETVTLLRTRNRMLEGKLEEVTREMDNLRRENDTKLREKDEEVSKLREQLRDRESTAAAGNGMEVEAVNEDPQIARQLALLQDEILPHVSSDRSDEERTVLDNGIPIIELFSNMETEPLLDAAYPSLKFRSGFEPGSHVGFTETKGIVRGSAAEIIAKRLDSEDWTTIKLVEKVNAHNFVCKLEVHPPLLSNLETLCLGRFGERTRNQLRAPRFNPSSFVSRGPQHTSAPRNPT